MKKEKNYQEEYISLSGIRHYLLHYRTVKEDPVLLFIHGGPGQTEHTLMYIGCGQVVNIMENERTGFLKLKEAVLKAGDRKDLRKLAEIGEYPVGHFDMEVYRRMGKVRNLQAKYKLAAALDKSIFDG